ncbi:endoplasmic reticulum-Golgi intermediate compartment protein 1-like [Liolophura sinensis]|uniref:endoplasmic reticulum-Golgi intermediate compartment protein 1-like n=1 Tax=Liolophura sinensis TaxID=3198878 RepID=UPI00315925AA
MQFDIRRFDVYRKVPKDLTQPTLTGAVISISSILFIAFLFISELLVFISPDIVSVLYVDDPVQHSQKLPVFLNISLPRMKCEYLGLDIQDEMGRHEVGMSDATTKEPIYSDHIEGCLFQSHFMINKVPGNFHISTHSSASQPQLPDMAHYIHEVRFGQKPAAKLDVIKGSFNPLKDSDKTASEAHATHDYIVRIVPTVFEDSRNNMYFPFQYTFSHRDVIQQGHGGIRMPAIWFRYQLSPITAKYHEKRKPFYHFLTTVCAIIGGTFTVAGIIDSCIFTAAEIFKKAELGKLS